MMIKMIQRMLTCASLSFARGTEFVRAEGGTSEPADALR
jgi:hypothetical protein